MFSSTVCVPSDTTSITPDTAMMAPVFCARSEISSTDCDKFSAVMASQAATSTPLPRLICPASARISEALPRMAVKRTSSSSLADNSRRSAVPPAATGSRTTGIRNSLARFPAKIMESTKSIAPRLQTSPSAPATASSTSRISCAMVGEAPAASRIFAQSLTVTKLVMHCIRGALVRTCSNTPNSSIKTSLSFQHVFHTVQNAAAL